MSSSASIPQRLHRTLTEVAARLGVRGSDPALELAGRFGLRRFVQRHMSGDADLEPSPWLEHGAMLRKESRVLSRALRDAGLEHCFFKGIALLGRFYRIDDRRLSDIDLLIEPKNRSAVLAMLHARGYADLAGDAAWVPATERPGVTMCRVNPETGEPDRELLLDVHWGLESVTTVLPGEGVTIPSATWARVEYQQGLPMLPDEEHAALVLHHLVRHDLLHVRGLLDFALLWDALPRDAGRRLTDLARQLGVERALGIVGRVLVDDLMLFPLRGVQLGARDWRGRAVGRRMGLKNWLTWAAKRAAVAPWHVTVTRSLAWRRYLLADAPQAGRLVGELVSPPREYLRWRWPSLGSGGTAWRRHLMAAFRS